MALSSSKKIHNGRVWLRCWAHHYTACLLVQDVHHANNFLLTIRIGNVDVLEKTVVPVVLGPASRDPSLLEVIPEVPSITWHACSSQEKERGKKENTYL